MQKRAIYSILSVVLALVVASLTLVFAIGPHVSADGELRDPGITEPTIKYNSFTVDDSSYFTVTDGVLNASQKFFDLYNECSSIHVVIPNDIGATKFIDDCFADSQSTFNVGNNLFYFGKFVSIVLPDSLTSIGTRAFASTALKSITIPANVTEVGEYIFGDAVWGPHASDYELTEIIVENPDLMTNENLQPYASIMRYEAPSEHGQQSEPTEPENPEQTQPETPSEETKNEDNHVVNSKTNVGLIAGGSAGIAAVCSFILGFVLGKRRRHI